MSFQLIAHEAQPVAKTLLGGNSGNEALQRGSVK